MGNGDFTYLNKMLYPIIAIFELKLRKILYLSAAVAALDLDGENADRALAAAVLGAGNHQRLHHFKGLRIDNGLVVAIDVILRDFTVTMIH